MFDARGDSIYFKLQFFFSFFLVLDGIPLLFQVSSLLVMQIALNNTVPAPVSTHIASSRG